MGSAKISNLTTISSVDTSADYLAIVDTSATTTKKVTPDVLVSYPVQQGGMNYAADAGSTDAYAITLSPAPTSLTTGMQIIFKANTANTGACTLNVNSLGAVAIKKNGSTALSTGDISEDQIITVVYDGTYFQLQGGGSTEIASDYITNDMVNSSAAIAESKLALSYATHDNTNDPTADQKAALAGTYGSPSTTNEFVTTTDQRLVAEDYDPLFVVVPDDWHVYSTMVWTDNSNKVVRGRYIKIREKVAVRNVAFTVQGVTGVSTKKLAIGIYNTSGELLLQTGWVTVTTATSYSASINPAITLTPGVYILAFSPNNAASNSITYYSVSNAGAQAVGAVNILTAKYTFSAANAADESTALPATLGVLTEDALYANPPITVLHTASS